jgi:MFS transporter, SHS family, lactate transporter
MNNQAQNNHWAAVMAGFLGWTFDAFDFFLVGLCMPEIARTFHVEQSRVALATALTLYMRPLGALLFGLLADRFGRRRPLMINVIFFSTMSILSGLAPNFTTFIICRMLFGIGMGGEWGVGASLAMETVPPRLRGALSGLLQEGYPLGNLLATITYFVLFPHLPSWRPLFLVGGLPALLALFVRMRVKESAVGERAKLQSWKNLGRSLASNWPLFLFITLLMWMMNLASHGTQDMFPTFLRVERHFTPRGMAVINGIAAIGAIIGGVVVGLISDHVGRRRAMIVALLLAIPVIPLFAYSQTAAMLALGAFLMQFLVQGAWGVIPAHLSELSPDSVRGLLPGFAYQCGVLLAGSIAWVQSGLKGRTTYANAMALTALIVLILAPIVVGLGREQRGIRFAESDSHGEELDAS